VAGQKLHRGPHAQARQLPSGEETRAHCQELDLRDHVIGGSDRIGHLAELVHPVSLVHVDGPEFHVVQVPIVRRRGKPVAVYQPA